MSIKIVRDFGNKAILIVNSEHDGINIKSSDYFYKNEVSVSANGVTHTVDIPNIPFILMSCVCILCVFIITILSCLLVKQRIVKISDSKYLKEKYPLVADDFINKREQEQLIENNQEIHEINKTIDEIKNKIEEMKKSSSNE